MKGKKLTEEQRNKTRLGNRVRQARYRSKIKQKDDSSKPKSCKTVTKMLTRKEREKKRKYWRERQRLCRANHSAQKKRREKEKKIIATELESLHINQGNI